jgi:hypothetical protein
MPPQKVQLSLSMLVFAVPTGHLKRRQKHPDLEELVKNYTRNNFHEQKNLSFKLEGKEKTTEL